MLDRASTFANAEIVKMLQTRCVPVAIDQAYQRRQQDTEGEFYRKIAGQGPRNNFQSTTQGLYVATAGGRLLLFNNNRDPAKVQRLLKETLAEFEKNAAANSRAAVIKRGKVDSRYNVTPPVGGLVVRVQAKVLGGYEPTTDRWRTIFQNALSRDNLWISAAEHQALLRGVVASSLQQRIARFHLVDNTRGEPPMWNEKEIRELKMRIEGNRILGQATLRTARGDRSYQADLFGIIETKAGRIVRLDMVSRGEFQGEGPYTRNAPKGKFPLAISFSLADGTEAADRIPPQGSRGWLPGYLR
ncbi:MAG: hypothetical protein ABGX05_12620 [Pirellulaceae bacterium]